LSKRALNVRSKIREINYPRIILLLLLPAVLAANEREIRRARSVAKRIAETLEWVTIFEEMKC
jgi:hypothetical protein